MELRGVGGRERRGACFRMEGGDGCTDNVGARRIGNGPGDACSRLGKDRRRGENGRAQGDTELSKHGNLHKAVWASLTAYLGSVKAVVCVVQHTGGLYGV